MISHKHETIFVHIPKVAGISIEQVFLEELGLDYENRAALVLGKNINKNIGPPRLSHLTAEEYVKLNFISEKLFDEYFKFAFVRNPYDRVYSFYKYFGFIKLVGFESFVIEYLPRMFKSKTFYYFVKPMHNYIYSSKGKLLVDYIGKFEELSNDYKKVAQKLCINEELPHANKSENINFNMRVLQIKKIVKEYPNIISRISVNKNDKKKDINENVQKVITDLYGKDFKTFDYDG